MPFPTAPNSHELINLIELPGGRGLMVFGSYLGSTTGNVGRNLSVTDGTPAGTEPLGLGIFSNPARFGGRAYFVANTAATDGAALWSTDGTVAGTQLVEDLAPGPGSVTFLGVNALSSNANMLLFAIERGGQFELRALLPGAGASVLLDTAVNAPQIFIPASVGGEFVYAWESSAGLGFEFHRTDGTVGGTGLFVDANVGAGSSNPTGMASNGSVAYFRAEDATAGRELWRVDSSGAQRVLDLNPGILPGVQGLEAAMLGQGVVFLGRVASGEREVWYSDGTAAGTLQLVNASPGSSSSELLMPTAVGGVVYMGIKPLGQAATPYVTDGTPAGTLALSGTQNFTVDATAFVPFAGRVWYGAIEGGEQELFASDGTPAGTVLAAEVGIDPDTASSSPRNFVAGLDVAYFVASNGGNNLLYRTDGSAAGTVAVDEVVTFESLNPIGVLGRGLVYGKEAPGAGVEPWFVDGLGGAPVALGDLVPGSASSVSPLIQGNRLGVVYRGRLAFIAGGGSGARVWLTDGTAAGTRRLSDDVPALAYVVASELSVVADRLLVAERGLFGSPKIWSSDGTLSGTVAIDDPAFATADRVERLTTAGNRTYFVLRKALFDQELWVTSGRAGDARRVDTAKPGSGYEILGAVGDRLLATEWARVSIVEEDGVTVTRLLDPAGTSVTFGPSIASSPAGAYFYAYEDSAVQAGWWFTDGTPAGTSNIGPTELHLSTLGSDARAIFARSTFAEGSEPWLTDGSLAGTALLEDAVAGVFGSTPLTFSTARLGDRYLYAGEDPVVGRELHSISITAAGSFVAESFGQGCASGVPARLLLDGELRLGNQVTLRTTEGTPGSPVAYYFALQPALTPLGPCTLYLASPTALVADVLDGAGESQVPFQLGANPFWLGRSLYMQSAVITPSGPLGGLLELSSALELVFGS